MNESASNYTVLGGDRQEYGPASFDEVCAWIAEGRLSTESLARAAGKEWKRLSTFSEFEPALRAQAEAFRLPGTGPGPVPPIVAGLADPGLETRRVDVARCLSGSWKLLKEHGGLVFAACFLVWTIGFVAWFLPMAGAIYWVLRGALYGGLYLVVLRVLRGQTAAVGDVFSPFKTGASHLVMAGLLTSLLSWLGLFFCLLPGIYLFVAWIFALPLAADKRMDFWPAMELSRKVVTRDWFRLGILLLVAFLPFVIMSLVTEVRVSLDMFQVVRPSLGGQAPTFDAMLKAMSEIAQRNLPYMLATKCVLLFNLPFGVGALMHAYEDLFGKRSGPSA